MNNNFNETNIKNILAWNDYLKSGHFGDAKAIVDTYNEVFRGMRQVQGYTQCGSCLRRYVTNMYAEYQQYLKDKEEQLKALEVIDDFMMEPDEAENKSKKRGRPKKQ